MKKIKIIAINLLAIIFILIFIEICSFCCVLFRLRSEIISHNSVKQINTWFTPKNFHYDEEENQYRPIVYKKSNKRPIVLFGCSYTFGTTLSNDEVLSKQLSDYTNRTVYNRGIQNRGTAAMLWQLEQPEITEQIPDAEYFIYIFIYDHLRRNYLHVPNILTNRFIKKYYFDKNGALKTKDLNKFEMLIHSFYTSRLIENAYAEYKLKTFDMKLFDAILNKSQQQIHKKYKNAKVIMLVYNDEADYDSNGKIIIAEDENLNRICKKNNIKIIYTNNMKCGKDILERKYIAFDGWHPTKEAWQKIIPELSKQLHL